jgi:Tfp pilus assembly PilM family ATPase
VKSLVTAHAALVRSGRWLTRTLVEPPQPLLALEVRPRALAAVRLTAQHGRLALAAAACSDLPAGALEMSLTKPNVVDAEAFRGCLRGVLERAGALSAGPIALVLPDPAVRVAVLTPGVARGRTREVEESVRFRLHKALPFDVRSARLAWDGDGGDQTVVAIAPDEVLRSYEEALEALGYQPGLVVTASLALTEAIAAGAAGDRLFVNWDEGYVSFVVLRGGRPVLVRTLPGEESASAVARHAASTLQFHRDRLSGQPLTEVVLRSAALPGEEALGVLEQAVGLVPRLVQPWALLGSSEAGPEAQAVAGAAACALRRAA